ncbi:3'-5' exonuclease [Alistipes sp.]|uniref:3'-5' exonuclease n=1 Tax=Alistipes sp. TaxID=1872444 RepID=UPI003AEFB154
MTTVNTFVDKISNEQTALLPAVEFRGEIRIVEHERDIAPACKYLMQQPLVGFDTETRPSFRPGVTYRVSLLQLATPERCYLFRLNRIPLAKPILQLLESRQVLKIGADVAGDLRSLRQIRHFRDGGFVDLQTIAPAWGIEEKSLRKLSAIVLGKRVSKAQRLSNWEATTLTDKQQLYAATDAWVCTRIYDRLQHTPKIKRASARTPKTSEKQA